MNQDTSKIRLEILDNKRQELLTKLSAEFPDFVLGGGTALTLQIAHRQSYDLDFFREKEISRKILERLNKLASIDRVVRDNDDELTVYINNVKVTFLSYPFPKIFQNLKVENGLKCFPAETIAAQKAYTIGRRGAWRDYFDLYSILKDGRSSIKEIVAKASEAYGELFSHKIFLEQLVYFEDLDDLNVIPIGNRPIPAADKVKDYLKIKVKEYLKLEKIQEA